MIDQERKDLISNIKSLFDFDENGILPCLAPGMGGPIGMPFGVMHFKDNGILTGKALFVTWGNDKEAQIVENGISRKAENHEIRNMFEFYKKEVENYKNNIIDAYDGEIEDIPPYLQKRLGLIPYF